MKEHKHRQPLLLCFLLPVFLFFQSLSAVDFVFNGFNSSDMLLYGLADVESRILTLTNRTTYSIGRAIYPEKIPAKNPNSSYVYPFSTSFIFSMVTYKNNPPARHGIVFMFVPVKEIEAANPANYLGLLNFSNNGNPNNHVFGVELDVFKNIEFDDINANHVGIDLNSLKSNATHDAGYWPDNQRSDNSSNSDDEKSFKELKMNSGENYQVWIDYSDSLINVTMALAGMKRPPKPLLNVSLNLSGVFQDEMYVGFTSATGQLVESHKILAWSFSNSNFSLSQELVTSGLPSFVLPKDSIFRSKGFIAVITVGEEGKPDLVDWAWQLMVQGQLLNALDERLKAGGEFDAEEVDRVLHLGLLCAYHDSCSRPTMRQVVKVLEGKNGLEDEVETEDMDAYLLQRMKSMGKWSMIPRNFGFLSHPTFEDIRQSQYSVPSLSWSSTMVEGRSGRASAQTDVFEFGILILEVMCGRRPIEEGKPPLVDWAWLLMVQGQLMNALDERLKGRGEFDKKEVERVLHLGLLCSYPDPSSWPTLRQVIKVLEGNNEVAEEVESEDTDAYLLRKMKPMGRWSEIQRDFGSSSHPTFKDIRQFKSSSMSISWSNTMAKGR
ncbi:hypothetical protein FH972_000471 [Carpinus fangiana]|uniref:Legume lectin domain-containing protein n=1 Tax=Carpinus fangiana TaxID=176857 RepID=A0A5N6QBV3_9ROSI|nr:hypothetical protein FH972_000471 [Carpinus fangiana]